jgi:hypothetical protein
MNVSGLGGSNTNLCPMAHDERVFIGLQLLQIQVERHPGEV